MVVEGQDFVCIPANNQLLAFRYGEGPKADIVKIEVDTAVFSQDEISD
jgi:hypothetical protein